MEADELTAAARVEAQLLSNEVVALKSKCRWASKLASMSSTCSTMSVGIICMLLQSEVTAF